MAGPDWTVLVRMALEHGMTPALLAALEAADQTLVPDDLLNALRQHCDGLRERSRYLVSELHALLDCLDRDGVEAIAFKGPLLSTLLFGDSGSRVPGDLDLLVRPADVSRVCEVLDVRGYVPSAHLRGDVPLTRLQHQVYRRYQCEYQFVRPSDGVIVEPHWGFAQRMLAIDVDVSAMFDRRQAIGLNGRPVRTLGNEDLLFALCIHGGKHRWERLAWIRDVAALLATQESLDLSTCVDRARSSGCSRLLLLGLALARRCAGVEVPTSIDGLIRADPTVAALEQEVMIGLFDPARPAVDNAKVDRFRFRMRERWRDRLHYVSRTLLVPRRRHIAMVALPASLLWAYYPLRWSHDYLALPLWRLAHAGRRARADCEKT